MQLSNMFELFSSLFAIVFGTYGILFYKKENKEALEQRNKLNKLLFKRELKVGHISSKISEYMTLLVSITFLIVGIMGLYRILFLNI